MTVAVNAIERHSIPPASVSGVASPGEAVRAEGLRLLLGTRRHLARPARRARPRPSTSTTSAMRTRIPCTSTCVRGLETDDPAVAVPFRSQALIAAVARAVAAAAGIPSW